MATLYSQSGPGPVSERLEGKTWAVLHITSLTIVSVIISRTETWHLGGGVISNVDGCSQGWPVLEVSSFSSIQYSKLRNHRAILNEVFSLREYCFDLLGHFFPFLLGRPFCNFKNNYNVKCFNQHKKAVMEEKRKSKKQNKLDVWWLAVRDPIWKSGAQIPVGAFL